MLQTPAGFLPLIQSAPTADIQTLVFHKDRLLLREEGLALPPHAELIAAGLELSSAMPLGTWGGRYWQVAQAPHDTSPLPGHAYLGLRTLFGAVEDGLLGVAGRAFQIAEWARTHRFCGACGSPMLLAPGERAMRCTSCSHLAYPRISPAMMVLIKKGKQRLLAAHANSPYKRYTALAGFLEAGESVEEAVHREVFEEVGLRVHNLKYFGSQSWPFPHSLMIAFTAEYLDGEIVTDPNEISDARWFGPEDEWPTLSHTVSIASELLAANRP
ncbi:NAD+ diphosphatase [Duganella sp. CF458]|uniref:NAD(+) diphosphatase n=1 Tax=Duganella sp. CF458 TaxID=1884368 RepID=UPI0008E8B993|nr:NAD(+) diphosphatase [Duganella sp. CF458]SFF63639.1 NAD+ diphosphatase [Duganella sp. CF458]